jgi:hypothetical protein
MPSHYASPGVVPAWPQSRQRTSEYRTASSLRNAYCINAPTAVGPIPSPMRLMENKYTAEACPRMVAGIIC